MLQNTFFFIYYFFFSFILVKINLNNFVKLFLISTVVIFNFMFFYNTDGLKIFFLIFYKRSKKNLETFLNVSLLSVYLKTLNTCSSYLVWS